ncbi:MAG: hypothetical protein ACUZ8I_10425 [Candidatus Scalindua sp.]
MARDTVENKYHVSQATARGANQYQTTYFPRPDGGNSARVGDKLTHINGSAWIVAAALGSNGGVYENNRFTFSDFSLDPPYAGKKQVGVWTMTQGGRLERELYDFDYFTFFDKGEDRDASTSQTVATLSPTQAGSYIQFNRSIPSTTKIFVEIS